MRQGEYTARLDLPTGPPAVSFGRAAGRLVLSGWGVVDDALLDRVELVISELVSNAVRHARGYSALELSLEGKVVTAAVTDSDPRHPTPRDATDGDGGRGLSIVDALSTRWGSEETPDGKRVWARMDHKTDHIL